MLSNSIKFTPPGGEVTLRAVNDQDSVRIDVLDTGPGLFRLSVKRLFQRFTAATTSTAALGLACLSSAAIVNLHGFSLEVDNRPGGGARLTLHCRQSLISAQPRPSVV